MAGLAEVKMRELVAIAWRGDDVRLACELEALAFRCLGINLEAERRERLAESDRRRADGKRAASARPQ